MISQKAGGSQFWVPLGDVRSVSYLNFRGGADEPGGLYSARQKMLFATPFIPASLKMLNWRLTAGVLVSSFPIRSCNRSITNTKASSPISRVQPPGAYPRYTCRAKMQTGATQVPVQADGGTTLQW